MIVGVLAQDQVMGYELMIPGLVFGMAKLAATERADNDSPQYEVRLCGQSPSITTDAAVLFVDEGPVLTSAGVASGMDLCVPLIRRHEGPDVAAGIARRAVMPAWRDGGQAQNTVNDSPADAGRPLQPTIAWMEEISG